MCNYAAMFSLQLPLRAWSESCVLLLDLTVSSLAVGFKTGDDDNRGSGR
jgi:hypothetical protein